MLGGIPFCVQAKAVAGVKAAGADFPPADMLLDLCTRFILNCPEEEWQSSERIMFHVEQARCHASRATAYFLH